MQNKTYKVIQITDCHLFKDTSLMLEVDTDKTFKEVIQRVSQKDLDDADAIFLTGDLSQDESPGSYEKIVNALESFSLPIYWIPGNHDCVKTVEKSFSKGVLFNRVNYFNTDYWTYIFLDTKIEGYEHGYLSEGELENLRSSLQQSSGRSIAIIMHHHPAKMGTPMIDSCMLTNPADFWSIVSDYNVKLIMCGHVHGDYSIKYNEQITIEASPSTCIQWAKGAIEPTFENKIGYKIYQFENNNYVSQAKIWNSF